MGMELPEAERHENDMTRTGKFCPADKYELEQVTGENRYTCHMCGGIFKLNEEGKVEVGWFEGFKSSE